MSFGRSLCIALPLALGCSSSESQPQMSSSRLPPGIVARVGAELVSSLTVARIAEQQGVPPQQAAKLAVDDALFAQAARTSAAFGTAPNIARAATARTLLEQLARDAERLGPPSQRELAEIVAERWLELARPDAVRTVHAVVMNDKPERRAAAWELAEKVALAVQAAGDSKDFIRLARAVPAGNFQIRAEALPPVTGDGRAFDKHDGSWAAAGTFDVDFARAANALERPQQLSPIVKSQFGLHVIRLEERIAGSSTPQAELAGLLAPEVRGRRAARARRELLDNLKRSTAIEIDRAAEELTARTKTAP